MSTLKAEVVKVDVLPHPNADRLDLVQVKGWQCVAQKGQYKSGDLAVYLPIDSVLPEQLVKDLGIEKNYHKRLRTIKLRGYISQGMVMPMGKLPTELTCMSTGPDLGKKVALEWKEGDDATNILGVTKYDPPIPVHMSGIQLPDEPGFLKYTDIENIKNYPNVFQDGEYVIAAEKIHGTNFRAAKLNGKLFVGSHKTNLKENVDNLYWRGAKLLDLEHTLNEGEHVFAEVYGYGVQDLQYGCKAGEIKVAVFDFALSHGQYVGMDDLVKTCLDRKWPMAPIVARNKWTSDFVKQITTNTLTGKWIESRLCLCQMMEGIVLRPEKERYSELLQGRCIIKAINDEYLIKADRTEYH